jgi:hypothetical protein
VASQLVLPGIAAQRLRSSLANHGHVESVHVSAFPALRLLFGSADSVSIHMSDLQADLGESGNLIAEAGETGRLDVHIDTVTIGPLTVHDVNLRKRGETLTATAIAAPADLRAALPPGLDVQPIASGGGQLVLRASASLFGVGLAADAVLAAREGKLVVQPYGIPLGGLFTLTVFADPRVDVEGVSADVASGGYEFTATAKLT